MEEAKVLGKSIEDICTAKKQIYLLLE